MNMTRFRELLRRDGWLYAAIALCVVLALSVSAISGSSPDEETRIARGAGCTQLLCGKTSWSPVAMIVILTSSSGTSSLSTLPKIMFASSPATSVR